MKVHLPDGRCVKTMYYRGRHYYGDMIDECLKSDGVIFELELEETDPTNWQSSLDRYLDRTGNYNLCPLSRTRNGKTRQFLVRLPE